MVKKFYFFLFTMIIFILSCGQNDNKQKELELKEREIALKEKEFALKQKEDSLSNRKADIDVNTSPEKNTKKSKMDTLPALRLPFIGKRYFSFYGGPGTGESITITENGRVIIKEEPGRGEPSEVVYTGVYKEINHGYKIVGNKIYWIGHTGCIGDGPCVALLGE